jgi:peptidoglycan hydrolase CwlO-like protein
MKKSLNEDHINDLYTTTCSGMLGHRTADLTKVLEDKSKELEDVIAEYKGKLTSAREDRDAAQAAAAALRGELATLKGQHAKELAVEKEASEDTIIAVQQEKTGFEAFVREMSRKLLGKYLFPLELDCDSPRAW